MGFVAPHIGSLPTTTTATLDALAALTAAAASLPLACVTVAAVPTFALMPSRTETA